VRRRSLLSLGLAAGMGGCAALTPPMTTALMATAPADLPRRIDLGHLPFFPDAGHLCGPAALASVLSAAGAEVDIDTLTEQVYLPGREGSLQIEMLAAARRHGRLAMVLPPELLAVLHELAQGTPALLLLNLGLDIVPRWHYAVLVGYDLDRGEVLLHTGTRRADRWPLRTLEFTWARSAHWAMVVTDDRRLPVNASPERLWPALTGLDRSGPPGVARPFWTLAQSRWPSDLNLALGRANNLLADGDLAGAGGLLEATARQHDSAVAWNNLAQVRWRLGDREAAQRAALQAWRRASETEPAWRDAVRGTLAELGLPPP
jgi:hypothetical protein